MGSNLVGVTWTSEIAPASSKEFLDIQANYGVLILSETRTWHDNNIQSNAPYRYLLTRQLNVLVSFAKWFSVRLRTKCFQVRMSLLSLKIQIWLFILRFFNNNCFRFFFPSTISWDSLSTSADTPSSSSSWLFNSYLYGLFLLFFIVLFLFGLNLAYSLIFYFPEKVS